MSLNRIRVLIVDDSSLVRKALTDTLSTDPEIEVVGTAIDPYVARDKILKLRPDVLTLDMEMPRMDGLSFLKLLMKHHPMPVIIISSLTQSNSAHALEALQAGAVDVIAKPDGPFSTGPEIQALCGKIKAAYASRGRLVSASSDVPAAAAPTPVAPRAKLDPRPAAPLSTDAGGIRSAGAARLFAPKSIILIGASTGGTEAIRIALAAVKRPVPPICIVQHIPAHFSRAFAQRLNHLCSFEVREAQNGDILQPGLALVAPGGFHMGLTRTPTGYGIELNEGPHVHHQRPAVDVLFNSAVKVGAAPHALALLLTGMGADGAQGMLKLKEAGAKTVAQDEASCVVFGMPREAIQLGAALSVLPLQQMAGCIERFAATALSPEELSQP